MLSKLSKKHTDSPGDTIGRERTTQMLFRSAEADARRLKYYVLTLVVGWTLAVGLSAAWNLSAIQRENLEAARITARAAYFKDLMYRRWNASLGGVYAPVTENLQPNPYLNVPDRDIETRTGQKLTLVNPAYMTRMVHEIQQKTEGIRGHITSLHPIRPGNAPDEWETEALKALEKGEKEVSSVEVMYGEPHMRLMRPLKTEKACLGCHASQGYKVGDIRGGISVSVPVKPLWSIASSQLVALFAGHTGLWALGMIGILIGARRLDEGISDRKQLREQLLYSQKMEAIGTLSAGVAHDFNNLLTIMNGYTELILSEKTEGDPDYEDLKKIHVTGLKGAEMVQKLLAFSKRSEMNLQPTDLNGIVRDTVTIMQNSFPRTIEIETILDKDLRSINADAFQMKQILMNLGINAKEAMPEGGKLSIQTQNVFADKAFCRHYSGAWPGPHVLMTVSDTGKGMDAETLDRIFDPFFTTKGWDFNKGTGLGLSVAKGIVEQHGGWIACESKPGKGSTFRAYFRAIVHPALAENDEAGVGTVPVSGKILLVDDEELVQEVGRRILEQGGYKVITVSNCDEALEIYVREQSSISLIVLDLITAQMSDEKCLEKVLKINPQATVIVSSGRSLTLQELDRLLAHAKGFVSKPFETAQLIRTVKAALDT